MFGVFDYIFSFTDILFKDDNIDLNSKIVFENNNSSDIYNLVFLSWHISYENSKKINLISKNENNIIVEIPDEIVSPNPETIKKVLINLIHRVEKEIKEKKIKKLKVLGLSLGNYPAYYFINRNYNSVIELISISPGSTIEESIFTGIRTKKIMKEALSRGYSLEYFQKKLKGTNPIDNINFLPKKTTIYLSFWDRYIKYYLGKELSDKIQEKVVKVNYFLGHIGGIMFYCLKNKD